MKQIFLHYRNRGYTLVELVVYVGLVAFLSVLVVDAIVSLTGVFREIRAARDIQESGLTLLDTMGRDVRGADAIHSNSIFGATSSKLVLEFKDGVATTTKEFSISGDGAVHVFVEGVDEGRFTGKYISVKNFFLVQATTTTTSIIRVTITLEDSRDKKSPRVSTFTSAFGLRTDL